MKIGGLQKLTLVDYPGKVAATVFLIGCNFRCPFCQNPELVDQKKIRRGKQISEEDFFNFLKEKRDFIEGVCISGGEPTIHLDLPDFISKIKEMNFLVKLDTNGSNPEVLVKLIKDNLVDFIAMDIKTSIDEAKSQKPKVKKYDEATGIKVDLDKIKRSAEIIENSGVDYEFRTTVVPRIVDKSDVEKIGKWLKGAKKIALQQFQNKKVLDKKFQGVRPYGEEKIKEFAKILEENIKEVVVRL